jgi:hypothetical protein
MKDEFLTLFEAAKALITYIDKEYVFDKAAAGGCSGMDYHLSDQFYDLIVNTRTVINEVENGLAASDADSGKQVQQVQKERCVKLFEAVKALIIHIDKARAFDKVNDMGPVGVETYQSDTFVEIIQSTHKAVEGAESGLL